MGQYVNSGNSGFQLIRNTKYIDKSGMIELINGRIDTTDRMICISRPRRFGKSYAAQMLSAYYDCSCDSHDLFAGLEAEKTESFEKHINKYNVICLDIAGFLSALQSENKPVEHIANVIAEAVRNELISTYTNQYPELKDKTLNEGFRLIAEGKGGIPGRKFVFILDEWDAVIREVKDKPEVQESYLKLLRSWFKDITFTPNVVAAAYMTGILPIRKDGSQSAISDFREYSMLEPDEFAPFFGFVEEEVKGICQEYGLNFGTTKYWYDGYTVGSLGSVYNPYSVMSAAKAKDHRYKSYWKKTSAAETLMTYIDMDFEGLQDDIARLMSGETIEIDTEMFQNDVETFAGKDDVLTLLVHLGYLTFEMESETYGSDEENLTGLARIPNEEIRREFEKILRRAKHKALIKLVRQSDKLLEDVIAEKNEDVARTIQQIHDSNYGPTFYNDEQSLRSVLRLGSISWRDQYAKVEELPSGHGVADLVFLPKRRSSLPSIVIELKWDKSHESALQQIKDRNYPEILQQLECELLLVGVNYDSKEKKHTCMIERVMK